MAYSKTEKKVWELAEPITVQEECFIYDVEYVKEGGVWFLRVYIDKDGGVSLDECEAVSRALSTVLDEADPIQQNYYLEVSSPGIERKLKTKEHFDRYIGETIDIGLYKAIKKSKQLTGKLISFEDDVITVEVDGESFELPLKETTGVKLHFEF